MTHANPSRYVSYNRGISTAVSIWDDTFKLQILSHIVPHKSSIKHTSSKLTFSTRHDYNICCSSASEAPRSSHILHMGCIEWRVCLWVTLSLPLLNEATPTCAESNPAYGSRCSAKGHWSSIYYNIKFI